MSVLKDVVGGAAGDAGETLPLRPSQPHRYLLRSLSPLCRSVLRGYYDLAVTGLENLPADGPVVVAANHMGFLDGPLMAAFTPRPVHALTKAEMFSGRMGAFLTQAGQIPLERHGVDARAVHVAQGVLEDGGVVGIFPEGARGAGEMRVARPGAAYLARVTGACVVPLVFLGTREPRGLLNSVPPRGTRMVLRYGEPLAFERREWPRRSADLRADSALVRAAIAGLLERTVAETGIELPGPVPDAAVEEEIL